MSKDEYLIADAPLKALTVFAMPMILGSFFQQIYNMADSIKYSSFDIIICLHRFHNFIYSSLHKNLFIRNVSFKLRSEAIICGCN